MRAITTNPPNSTIPALFRQWVEAQRAAERISAVDRPQADFDTACELIWAIERKLLDTPAQNVVDFAVKAYLAAHHKHPPAFGAVDPAGLSAFDTRIHGVEPEQDLNNHFIASMMRDAARFLPEIAELAAPMLKGNGRRADQANVVWLYRE